MVRLPAVMLQENLKGGGRPELSGVSSYKRDEMYWADPVNCLSSPINQAQCVVLKSVSIRSLSVREQANLWKVWGKISACPWSCRSAARTAGWSQRLSQPSD